MYFKLLKLSFAVIAISMIIGLFNYSCNKKMEKKDYSPSHKKTQAIEDWEKLRLGAFIHFNDNPFVETEISKNTDPKVFNPVEINFDGMMETFQMAGIKYAVLTTRHTSGFCLWDSKVTEFDVANSEYKNDVVRLFVDACRKHDIKPCFYYCLWGSKFNPADWNPQIKKELLETTPKDITLAQLTELSTNYEDIYEFWLDMQVWADTALSTQDIYNHLKSLQPNTLVHFNQHVQDGATIKYFPTDILNGEERIPPVTGHEPYRTIENDTFYLPFEYEITSQQCPEKSLGNGLMEGSVWFTYIDSRFYPVDSLYKYIKQSFDRGGSNILLSTAPDRSGSYRQQDKDSLIKLGNLIWEKKL
jgi:alpha-L-fucosidase